LVVLAFFSKFLKGTTTSCGMLEKSGGGVRYESVVVEVVKLPKPPFEAFELFGSMGLGVLVPALGLWRLKVDDIQRHVSKPQETGGRKYTSKLLG